MKTKRYYRTDFLFSRSSFSIGAGSILALMGNYYEFNSSPTTTKADKKAIESNWGVVGKNLYNAMVRFNDITWNK